MRGERLASLRTAAALLGIFLMVEAAQVAGWSRDLAMGLLMGAVVLGLLFFFTLGVKPTV